MEESIRGRLKHAWNAFTGDRSYRDPPSLGTPLYSRPDRHFVSVSNEKSIVTSIYNRIAIDVSSVDIRHVRLNDELQFDSYIKSGLDYCLTQEANIDQTGRALIQDAVMTLCESGSVAIVPVETSLNPDVSGSFDVVNLRVGEIVGWYPKHIKISLYNEKVGRKEAIVLPKKIVCVVENPLYATMNEPNSTLKRLNRKLALLDKLDSVTGAGKLDMIIQLPYVIKSEARRQQAEIRRSEIEKQLSTSSYGIAYTDGTERITQLNRPVENTLQSQIEYLTSMLYAQLGLTEEVFNGSADQRAMLNYFSRTVEPILSSITENMSRKFLTKTARTQGQTIRYFRDPFKLVPVGDLAEIADKFTRNEILSSNEVRAIMGLSPSNDPRADELRNKNLNPTEESDNKNNSKEDELPDEES